MAEAREESGGGALLDVGGERRPREDKKGKGD
jgi:hypothetical protein